MPEIIDHLQQSGGFFNSAPSPADSRLLLTVHEIGATGILGPVIVNFRDILAAQIHESERDIVQILPASDGNKLLVSGEEVPMYNISGFVPDTNLSKPITVNGSTWDGHSYRALVNFVEYEANVGVLARRGRVLRVSYGERRILGAIVALNGQITSDMPHAVQVTLQLIVFKDFSNPIQKTDETSSQSGVSNG